MNEHGIKNEPMETGQWRLLECKRNTHNKFTYQVRVFYSKTCFSEIFAESVILEIFLKFEFFIRDTLYLKEREREREREREHLRGTL